MEAEGRMKGKRDKVKPGERWTFDQKVTDAFDDMLARSIPQYDVMRDTVTDLAVESIKRTTYGHDDGRWLVDLGCSRGEALARVRGRLRGERYARAVQYCGVEVSAPMVEAARKRFPDQELHEGDPFGNAVVVAPTAFVNDVTIIQDDLRHLSALGFDDPVGCTLAVLALMFVPINYRQQILRHVYNWTAPGGALIVVEKVLGEGAMVDDMMVERYHALKLVNGYPAEAVERKALSLEGVLVPVTASMNVELLRGAGFRHVDCFWRWMSFAGWIAIRD